VLETQVEDQAQVAEEVDLTALALVAQEATEVALAQEVAAEQQEQTAWEIQGPEATALQDMF
jgi:hypothetical protein